MSFVPFGTLPVGTLFGRTGQAGVWQKIDPIEIIIEQPSGRHKAVTVNFQRVDGEPNDATSCLDPITLVRPITPREKVKLALLRRR